MTNIQISDMPDKLFWHPNKFALERPWHGIDRQTIFFPQISHDWSQIIDCMRKSWELSEAKATVQLVLLVVKIYACAWNLFYLLSIFAIFRSSWEWIVVVGVGRRFLAEFTPVRCTGNIFHWLCYADQFACVQLFRKLVSLAVLRESILVQLFKKLLKLLVWVSLHICILCLISLRFFWWVHCNKLQEKRVRSYVEAPSTIGFCEIDPLALNFLFLLDF